MPKRRNKKKIIINEINIKKHVRSFGIELDFDHSIINHLKFPGYIIFFDQKKKKKIYIRSV